LATAWAKDRIQVNAVLPGWIDTDLTKRARQQVQGLHESVEKRTPEGRWGVPSDLAGVAAFLASGASDFVTGTAIPVDGGFSIGMSRRFCGSGKRSGQAVSRRRSGKR
jgi:2-deoxy-D-gluconate 3-dehydrogenase